ncbi:MULTISPECIES: hypothetical protein [unclassified Shewanella]|uniref:hypothetical protein n=1 Tax=unclassified Shewanella TaxID=196818 RepID=UPI000F712685|nr:MULTISPECIES: hypothetical protein [unclassified Shewanella]MDH0448135.1 hypothetical protein [Shewanella sp. GD04112]MDH1469861.1 hypothetical protein [Shewanella sp. GD03713]VEE63718.1 Uncharacterised protein [Shewanella putrefaciens]
MTSNASVQFHMRFVKEKHKELIESLNELVNHLVGEKLEVKKSKADVALTKSNDLKASISQQDTPDWLPSLIDALQRFKSGSWNQTHLINHLITYQKKIKEHVWIFDNPSEQAFDFDAIFQHYKSESRLSELFSEIVTILEQIQNSGEVDSVSMMSALGKVIATLKQNQDGSYFSINSAWSFLVSFLKNYMWSELSKIPVLGSAMEALEKTIKETNEEMFRVHNNVQASMRELVEAEVKGLVNKSSFSFVGYDKTGLQLPNLDNPLKIDASV